MRKTVPPGFVHEHYIVVETKEYMILREVQSTLNKDTWRDAWCVADLSNRNWNDSKGVPYYMIAESFELALACAKGITLMSDEYGDEDEDDVVSE